MTGPSPAARLSRERTSPWGSQLGGLLRTAARKLLHRLPPSQRPTNPSEVLLELPTRHAARPSTSPAQLGDPQAPARRSGTAPHCCATPLCHAALPPRLPLERPCQP